MPHIQLKLNWNKLRLAWDILSLNNGLKCRKPVFMWVSGICFIKWLWFGSICGESNSKISDIDADSIVEMIYIDSANEG